jgi:hypothetical protein
MATSFIHWKEKSLTQILASVQKNKNDTTVAPRNAQPLKIYRKEICESPNTSSSRLGVTINSFEVPGGNIISNQSVGPNSLVTYINEKDVYINDMPTEQQNARKRIRSSGIINKNYSVDTRQYLTKRGISSQQNQFNYLRNDGKFSPQISECPEREIVYKPNNSQFACQGGVSSSSLILRKKFNTISSNANKYLIPYGPAVANAMQYGTSKSIYTYKNKFAFPTKMTPIFDKTTGSMQTCSSYTSKR